MKVKFTFLHIFSFCIWLDQALVSSFLVIYVLYWDIPIKKKYFVLRYEVSWVVSKISFSFSYIYKSSLSKWFLFRMFENRVPHMLDGDYTPYSAVDIFVKDLVWPTYAFFFIFKLLIWPKVIMRLIMIIIIYRALFLMNVPPLKFPFRLPLSHINCSCQVLFSFPIYLVLHSRIPLCFTVFNMQKTFCLNHHGTSTIDLNFYSNL